MQKWQRFEQLVAQIHQFLNSVDYDVEADVIVTEPSGVSHQVDVLLRPKTPFAGPVLVSCKAWSTPVGIEHIREWSDIVQQTGAASGVVVAEVGFTAGAMDAARNPARRISLWKPRPLFESDFAPDKSSPTGYIRQVNAKFIFMAPRVVEGSMKLDAERMNREEASEKVKVPFSAANRHKWYLRDEDDNIIGNLWDEFQRRSQSASFSCHVAYIPMTTSYLVAGGKRLVLNSLSFDVIIEEIPMEFNVDFQAMSYGYENMITGDIKYVPVANLPL